LFILSIFSRRWWRYFSKLIKKNIFIIFFNSCKNFKLRPNWHKLKHSS